MKLFKFSKQNGMYQKGSKVILPDTTAEAFAKVGLGNIVTENPKTEKPKAVTKKTTKKAK